MESLPQLTDEDLQAWAWTRWGRASACWAPSSRSSTLGRVGCGPGRARCQCCARQRHCDAHRPQRVEPGRRAQAPLWPAQKEGGQEGGQEGQGQEGLMLRARAHAACVGVCACGGRLLGVWLVCWLCSKGADRLCAGGRMCTFRRLVRERKPLGRGEGLEGRRVARSPASSPPPPPNLPA